MRITGLFTLERLARILADILIVNGCYLAALVLRVLLESEGATPSNTRNQLAAAFGLYLSHFWLLTPIAISVYSLSGFYTRGRFYRSRFKALAILQAVSLSYLIFGFIQYVWLARAWLVPTPRVAMALSWGLTLGATVAARLWAEVWRVIDQRERPLRPEANRKGPIRRVLVTGGAGYIGSMLCRQLLRQGYSVRVLDALLYGQESIADLERDPRFELVTGDSRDVGAVFSAMLETDAVIHLGELVGDPACAVNENLTLEINFAATRMLAEAARGYGVKRFIYVSSCSVYGASDDLLDERSALNPVSLYARAKIGSEKALLELSGDDFHPIILRLATVFGLSYRPRFDLVVNLLTAKAEQEGEITVFNGDQWRPFVHVGDVGRAMIRCLQVPLETVTGQIFNVGSDDQNYTIQQIGEMVHSIVPESRLVSKGDDGDRRNYRVSFAKINRQLGFTCQFSAESGIREILGAFRDGRIRDYRAARYSNYTTLTSLASQVHLKSRRVPELYQPAEPMPLHPLSPAVKTP